MNHEFEQLKELLFSESWPEAVNPYLICNPDSEDDKRERADTIVDIAIGDSLKGKKFLDFGCGEGHVVFRASKEASLAMGYDLVVPQNNLLSDNFDVIKSAGPYDVILLYDVLDHCSDPVLVLKLVKEVSANNATIVIRCHPWIGRHGGHIYQKLNKAFVHIVFNDAELKQLGYDVHVGQKIIYPIRTYQKWFKDSGLKTKKMESTKDTVEDFFVNNELVSKRIMQLFDNQPFPKFHIEQSFVDITI